jgi:type IV pilus assembly protein PilQ
MVKVGSMRKAKRILLIASVLAVSVHGAGASIWNRQKSDKQAEAAAAPAAMSLAAVETDSARVVLRTSGTPAYTSYSPSPEVFVIDLTATAKGSALAIPATLPAGIASITADEAVEMGNRLTRVTFRLAHPLTLEASAEGNSVIVSLPGAEMAAVTPVAPLAAEPLPAVVAAAPVAEPPADTPHVEAIPEPAAVVAEPTASAETLSIPRARSVKRIETAGSGEALEIRISGDGALAYNAFRLENPSRLVIDLAGVKNSVAKSSINVADPLVKRVRVGQFKTAPDPVTRVVVDLGAKSNYQIIPDGESLRVSFGAGTSTATSYAPASNEPAAVSAAATAMPEPARAVAEPAPSAPEPVRSAPAPVSVATSSPASSVPAASSMTVIQPAAKHQTPAPKAATADVTSRVPTIADNSSWKMPERASRGAKPVINAPRDQSPPDSRRSRNSNATTPTGENVFVEQPDERRPQGQVLSTGTATQGGRTLSGSQKVFSGEPLSLNLKDADIKDVLRTFAQLTGLNVAVDPDVGGIVTVDFADVPWDQALDIILRQNGLTFVLEGNVMRIGTIARISAETSANRKLAEEERLNVPLSTVSFKLSYARATEVQALLRDLASPRARIIVDQRTNQLIISEIPQYLQTMQNLIESVDVPTRQVMIEARIVEASKIFSQQYGFEWGFNGAFDPALGNGPGLIFPNRIGYTGGPFAFSGGAARILDLSFTDVLGTFNLDFALNAAESESLVKVVSAPKVTTQDNTAAEIQSGVQIPYQTRVNFTTTISYIDATLRLSVTPQITEAGTVIMDVAVQKVTPGEPIEGAAGTPLNTRQAKTRVMVRDGGTAVIGGIYQVSDTTSQSRIPFIHQIPVLGNLFKSHSVRSSHDELLIFITPRILRAG